MPVMLNSRAAVEEHLHRLEIHYLASPDDQLHFALLSDWADARRRNAAERRCAARHRHPRHRAAESPLRRRRPAANASCCCIAGACGARASSAGWAGSASAANSQELNRLLRGATDTTYVTSTGSSPWVPAGVRYVLTLDADTRVPREAPRRLIGKMAHPLNRPRFDAQARPRGRGLRHPAAARGVLAAGDRRGLAVPARVLRRRGRRSLRRRGLRRLPGLVRRRLVRRQGHLRRRRLRGGARRPRARRARCSRTTCSKASSRAPASPPTSRWSRNSRRATTSPRCASIAGCAATGSCCRGSSAARRRRRRHGRGDSRMPLIGVWKMLDNLRRSLSAPASVAGAGRRLDAAARTAALAWSRVHRRWRWRCRRCCRCSPASCRAAPPSRCAATCARCATTSRWRWRRSRCSPPCWPTRPG